jgi:hypothetical protein
MPLRAGRHSFLESAYGESPSWPGLSRSSTRSKPPPAAAAKAWMPGARPGMTRGEVGGTRDRRLVLRGQFRTETPVINHSQGASEISEEENDEGELQRASGAQHLFPHYLTLTALTGSLFYQLNSEAVRSGRKKTVRGNHRAPLARNVSFLIILPSLSSPAPCSIN